MLAAGSAKKASVTIDVGNAEDEEDMRGEGDEDDGEGELKSRSLSSKQHPPTLSELGPSLSTIEESSEAGGESNQNSPLGSGRYGRGKSSSMLDPVPEDEAAAREGPPSPPRLLMLAHRNNSSRRGGGFNDSSSTMDVDTARTNESVDGDGEGGSEKGTGGAGTPKAGEGGQAGKSVSLVRSFCLLLWRI